MKEIVIRRATSDDARDISTIHCLSWRDAYANVLDPEFLAGPIEQDRDAVWSARFSTEDEAQVIFVATAPPAKPAAFICAYRDSDAQWGSLIDNLHVLPALRGQGIGERLMRAAARSLVAEAQSRGLHLWVFEANEAAMRFYRYLGGEVVEQAVSEIPAANGATVLRVFWRDLSVMSG
jgi:ribosomal protein S18 acetylase RimI-like enzyme